MKSSLTDRECERDDGEKRRYIMVNLLRTASRWRQCSRRVDSCSHRLFARSAGRGERPRRGTATSSLICPRLNCRHNYRGLRRRRRRHRDRRRRQRCRDRQPTRRRQYRRCRAKCDIRSACVCARVRRSCARTHEWCTYERCYFVVQREIEELWVIV
jgi:hypothetical protein